MGGIEAATAIAHMLPELLTATKENARVQEKSSVCC